MEFFKQADLDLIQAYAGQPYDEDKHEELKEIYEKIEFLCRQIKPHGFEFDIRKDPRKQAGPGTFEFRDYLWARVYPKEYYSACRDKFCYIVSVSASDSLHFHMMGYKGYMDMPASKDASKKSWRVVDIEDSDFDKVVQEFIEFDKRNRKLFISAGAALGISQLIEEQKTIKGMELIELLKYKKQIILQGPPGTGKTFNAKKIARTLCAIESLTLEHKEQIKALLSPGLKLKTVEGNDFHIEKITGESFNLKIGNDTDYTVSVDQVIRVDNDTDPKISGRSYSKAMANYVKEEIGMANTKLIQFHPAYSYEDFVRGITAHSTGKSVEYKTENKVLAEFAKNALDNWKASRDSIHLNQQAKVRQAILDFKDFLSAKLEDDDKVMMTKKVYVSRITESSIRYNSDAWEVDGGVPDIDLEKMYLAGVTTRREVKELSTLTKTARSLSTYWVKLLEQFRNYLKDNNLNLSGQTTVKTALKHYVLIIDEINRANLPAVLGELIYAMEYRYDENNESETTVESMYDLDGDRRLTLPPNLYIIGTMNTADRSVGHIDYAIRRRFAFVDILPSDTVIEEVVNSNLKDRAKGLYNAMAGLFTEKGTNGSYMYLASDFKPYDVQLGHSYFLAEDEEKLKLKLEYEIKPILREYVKDGVLLDSALPKIESLSV